MMARTQIRVIRAIASCSVCSQTSTISLDRRQGFCLDVMNVQADLDLCWTHKLVGNAVARLNFCRKLQLACY